MDVHPLPRGDGSLMTQFTRCSLRMKNGRAVGIVAVVYLISYLVLMDRHSPAIECGKGTCEVAFDSSFRFAKVPCDNVTCWNVLFYPLDAMYFTALPSQRKYGDQTRLNLAELSQESLQSPK